MIPVLQFNELDDFLAHVRCAARTRPWYSRLFAFLRRRVHASEQDTDWTHLEIGHVSGERDAHGIRGVTFYAIATRRFLSPAEYLVVWSTTLLNTTNVHLQMDKHEAPEHQTRAQLHANFEKVKSMLHERGLCVRPGKWSSQLPEYLR